MAKGKSKTRVSNKGTGSKSTSSHRGWPKGYLLRAPGMPVGAAGGEGYTQPPYYGGQGTDPANPPKAPIMKEGGKVKNTGPHILHKGEFVKKACKSGWKMNNKGKCVKE